MSHARIFPLCRTPFPLQTSSPRQQSFEGPFASTVLCVRLLLFGIKQPIRTLLDKFIVFGETGVMEILKLSLKRAQQMWMQMASMVVVVTLHNYYLVYYTSKAERKASRQKSYKRNLANKHDADNLVSWEQSLTSLLSPKLESFSKTAERL